MDTILRRTALPLKINNSISGRHHFKGKRILENALGILQFLGTASVPGTFCLCIESLRIVLNAATGA
jgi:hypothetical protein